MNLSGRAVIIEQCLNVRPFASSKIDEGKGAVSFEEFKEYLESIADLLGRYTLLI